MEKEVTSEKTIEPKLNKQHSEEPKLKFVLLYNKILSFYFIFLMAIMFLVGVGGFFVIFPLIFILFGWLYVMYKGIQNKKKYAYWTNLIIHPLLIIFNIFSLISLFGSAILGIPTTLFGVLISLINLPLLMGIISDAILNLAIIGASGFLIYTLSKKDVRALFKKVPDTTQHPIKPKTKTPID